ncbi:MAG: hypothetical protein M1837_001460 [Sclerophora amabilis]|nr:MAG: hypothetical protein M1837_001460 [Sclerophora amabilis]
MEKITDKIAALPDGANYFSLEFFPPKTAMGSSNLQTRLDRMARGLRPLFVTVTWGAGGSTASKSLELAEICQRQLGLTTCLHLTCTNMNRSLVDEALEEAKVLGVRNILALRGDPPRPEEYSEVAQSQDTQQTDADFVWAIDLVRYIRRRHGDYFCIGVAGYPEGHADESYPEEQSPEHDLPHLIEKTKAGADFIMTQLFFDVKAYEQFENMLRSEPSGVFRDIPIIPGLMPVQSYQILKRTTKLSHAKLPPDILQRLEGVKADDESVKRAGVEIISEMVERIKDIPSKGPRGFHFYTLNLEKAVAFILQQCNLIPPSTPSINGEDTVAIEESNDFLLPNGMNGINGINGTAHRPRRRESSLNSDPHNRVIVQNASSTSTFERGADEAGIPKEKINSRATTLAISEGEGSLGREATWDDYPNGRWGDARSPGKYEDVLMYSIWTPVTTLIKAYFIAYGEIDGYGVSLHVSILQATRLWGHPTSRSDISTIFTRHVSGELYAIPWSEEGVNEETAVIRPQLLRLNQKGWWTVASQPAVNGVMSDDRRFGWGPKNGFVFQKAFVEFFLPTSDWHALREKLASQEEISYFAGNAAGEFIASDTEAVNAVTWGAFPGKEIITPTIIEPLSFRAWLEEAFAIWTEWARVYRSGSPSAQLLANVRDDCWLVNIVHHGYVEPERLWELLLA